MINARKSAILKVHLLEEGPSSASDFPKLEAGRSPGAGESSSGCNAGLRATVEKGDGAQWGERGSNQLSVVAKELLAKALGTRSLKQRGGSKGKIRIRAAGAFSKGRNGQSKKRLGCRGLPWWEMRPAGHVLLLGVQSPSWASVPCSLA